MSPDAARPPAGNANALPIGSRLGEFELRSVLGIGGFGIVYLAFDHALEREVAIKEYMPTSLAGRTETNHVSLRSQSDADTFALGLRSFVNEARLLARFDHPALLKVLRFWEANGTAYMAMPVLRGQTVKQVRQAMGRAPSETWLRDLLAPLLDAVERLHAEGVYHRDIAPDNIQIEPDGHPVLLDFGAARRVIVDKSQALTAILKPAYAPIEQYGEAGSVKQGPWTDVYSLGATLHYLLLGHPPAPATARTVHDDASQLTAAALPGIGAEFLALVDWMLAPRPADRPQNIAAVRDVLAGRARAPVRAVAPEPPPAEWDATVLLSPTGGLRATDPPLLPTRPVAPATRPPDIYARDPAPLATAPLKPPTPVQGRQSNLWPTLMVGLVLAGLAGAAVLFWPRTGAPVATAATTATDTAPAGAAAKVPTDTATAPPPAAVLTSSAPASVPTAGSTEPAVTASTSEPKSPSKAEPKSRPAESAIASVVLPDRRASPPPRPTHTGPVAVAPHPAPAVTPAVATADPVPAAAPPPVVRKPPVQAAPPEAPPLVEAKAEPASGPEATCHGRNPLRYFTCMERECLRQSLQQHPDCLKWRINARHE